MFESTTGRTVQISGKSFLYFAGTSYLGLHVHPDWQALIREGQARYGTHYGGSRLFTHVPDIYDRVEHFFARQTGFEEALLCASGSLAGQLIGRSVPQDAEVIYLDAHPAVDSGRFAVRCQSVDELLRRIEVTDKTSVWIFTNSVYPSKGVMRNWGWIGQLTKDKRFTIVIDDSHGLGVLGKDGLGGLRLNPQWPNHIGIVGLFSVGKAYSTPGAIVLGKKEYISVLRRFPLWGGASPPPPGPLFALMEGRDLIHAARKRLTALVDYAERANAVYPVIHLRAFPVFGYEMVDLSEILYEKGVILSGFPYPTPDTSYTCRVVLNATHTVEDIDRVFEYIRSSVG